MDLNSYLKKTERSRELFEEAKRITAGTKSNIYFKPYPMFASRGKGSKIYDVDGNEYIDFLLGYGSLFLGHSPEKIVKIVKEQVDKGSQYGAPNELEIKLARKVNKMIPCAEMVRFANSGSEAVLHAIRLARGYTKRDKIIKFEGNYHGWGDPTFHGVWIPFDKPTSAGIPTDKNTIVLPYGNIELVDRTLNEQEIAAIIVEPVLGAGASGVCAGPDFLKALKNIAEKRGTVLIFDEVQTGFRIAPGGAQEYFGVIPHLATLGKILGGGYPIGAFVGRKDIMELSDETREGIQRWEHTHHGGTFNGNPISMSAGLATLEEIESAKGALNRYVIELAEELRTGLNKIFSQYKIKAQAVGIGPFTGTWFTDKSLKDLHAIATVDRALSLEWGTWLIANGIYRPPVTSWFLSTAHTHAEINKVLTTAEEFFKKKKP